MDNLLPEVRSIAMAFADGYALVIGVGSYSYITPLPISGRDAGGVAGTLCDEHYCGYLWKQVKILQNEAASRENILNELDKLRHVPQNSTVILFYSGHGEYGTDDLYYLTAHDTQIAKNKVAPGTGISEIEAFEALRRIPSQRLVVLLNACYAGEMSSTTLDGETESFGDKNLPQKTADKLLTSGRGRVLITAAGQDQRSWYKEQEDEFTFFTKALVSGLRGEGRVRDNAGFISVFDLYEHISTVVREEAAQFTLIQEPVLTVAQYRGPFQIALFRGASATGRFDAQATAPRDPAVRQLPRRPFNPPGIPPRLVGRDDMLSEVKRSLFDSENREFVVLYGLPGVGKTALALAITYDTEVQDVFRDGVLWASLDQTADNPTLLAELGRWADELGIPNSRLQRLRSVETRRDEIHNRIDDKRILMIVDNAQQEASATPFVVGGPSCARLLITSRADLAHQLTPKPTKVSELSDDAAFKLMQALAPVATEAAPDDIWGIVRAVGGLPLALVLLGKQLSGSGSGPRLRRCLESLQTLDSRQKPLDLLDKVVHTGLMRLSKTDRISLGALAVFAPKPNSFSEDAAVQVCQLTDETLDNLWDSGLLEDSGVGRYSIHPIIRDHTARGMDTSAVYRRMADYYVSFANSDTDQYDLLTTDLTNLRTALDLTYARQDHECLVQLVSALYPFFEAKGHYELAETHLERALQSARSIGNKAAAMETLLNLGNIAGRQGDYEKAETRYLDGMAIAQETNDEKRQVDFTFWLASVWLHLGAFDKVDKPVQHALGLASTCPDTDGMWQLLLVSGIRAFAGGEFDRAIDYFRQGMLVADRIKSFHGSTLIRTNLSETLIQSPQFDQTRATEARQLLKESLDLAERKGHLDRVAYCLAVQGLLETSQDNYDLAQEHLSLSLKNSQQTGNSYLECLARNHYGWLFLEIRRPDYSKIHFGKSLNKAQMEGYKEHEAVALLGLARTYHALCDNAAAAKFGRDSLRLFQQMGHYRANGVAAWLLHLGTLETGNPE